MRLAGGGGERSDAGTRRGAGRGRPQAKRGRKVFSANFLRLSAPPRQGFWFGWKGLERDTEDARNWMRTRLGLDPVSGDEGRAFLGDAFGGGAHGVDVGLHALQFGGAARAT